MKRRIIITSAVVILVIGVVILLLPFIYQVRYDSERNEIIENFEVDINDSSNNELLEELYRKLLDENERLYLEGQRELKDPFSYENQGIDLTYYGIEDNTIGYITIPDIDITLPIYLGASEDNMTKGAVHLTQTSYPIGGANSNSVIAAHRGYYKAKMFKDINMISVGDEVYIRNFRETLLYIVKEIKVINPNQVEEVMINEGEDMLTLISCHPYGKSTFRYVVYCKRYE
ncbi:MAG: class C sortase [Suipraeoptans sp.]